jgi:hypothetical protein
MEQPKNPTSLNVKLTQEQIDEIEKVFGEHVSEITFSTQEFAVGKEGAKFKVLKIDNIATVIGAAGVGQSVN